VIAALNRNPAGLMQRNNSMGASSNAARQVGAAAREGLFGFTTRAV